MAFVPAESLLYALEPSACHVPRTFVHTVALLLVLPRFPEVDLLKLSVSVEIKF